MNIDFQAFGWCMLLITGIFSVGLLPRFATRFYPGLPTPGIRVRLAAPLIFATLGVACFLGLGLPAFSGMALLGIVAIALHRRSVRIAGGGSPAPSMPNVG